MDINKQTILFQLTKIISCLKDGITLTKLVLDKNISCCIINVLKNFLKIFENNGLREIQGKNISTITKQPLAAVVSLNAVGNLHK